MLLHEEIIRIATFKMFLVAGIIDLGGLYYYLGKDDIKTREEQIDWLKTNIRFPSFLRRDTKCFLARCDTCSIDFHRLSIEEKLKLCSDELWSIYIPKDITVEKLNTLLSNIK